MPTDILTQLELDTAPEVAREFLALATDYLSASRDRDMRVSTDGTREALAQRFAEPLPIEGRPITEIIARLREDVIPDCNHLYHPRYAGHQVSAPLPAAIWTESLTAALNQSLAVWEMSPVATVLEHQVIRWLGDLAGFGSGSGGTLTTGGTEATLTALLAARAAALPDAWTDGVPSPAPLLICGEHVHYAVSRAAGILGLGMNNVLKIPSRGYAMDVAALRAAVEQAKREARAIMAIVATAGSTPTGSFDDLQAIADVADEWGVWLHVDAAHGGSALVSEKHRHRLQGLERARSMALDPHKMMLLPLQTGTLLVRDVRDLDRAFAQQAPYLFHGTGDDLGPQSLLCSRRADVFKLWVALQRYGTAGLGAIYDHLCDTTWELYEAVRCHPDFEALHEPSCNILCFRHTGSDEHNRELRERYNRSGEGWITTTMLDGRRVLRATIMNPRTTADDVREIVAGLARL